MSTLSTTASPGPAAGPKIYRCGTLTYTGPQLIQLFFWLGWNDFTIMMMENVNAFGKNLQIENHATLTQMGVFGTIGTILNIWINPVFSVWSDRTRTRWGRRRPFLLLATPPLALCIMAVPFMPGLFKYLQQFPLAVEFFHHVPMNGTAFLLGVDGLLLTLFNSMVLALFSYLYWDVVPQEVLGRWTAMSNVVCALGTLIWGFFLVGYAVHHMEALCVSVSLLCLVVYLVSTWRVKEGEYVKVDKHKEGGPWFASIRAYFVECYSDPFYLWIFGAFFVAGLANASNDFKGFYLRYDLHADYNQSGPIQAIPYIIPVVLGYFVGNIADKLHPIRIYVPTYVFWGTVCFCSYFFIHSKATFLFWSCLTQVAIFANGVTYGALLPQIYPRAKFGQFCSANQLCGSVGGLIAPIPVGMLFDHLHNYRFAYLFSADFLFAAALLFLKVQKNYEKRHGHVPVPHAG